MTKVTLTGLVAATHTPFSLDGALNLAVVEKQAEHLLRNGVTTVFIGGTTGEWSSLTVEERRALAVRWLAVTRGSVLKVIVHVGAHCLEDARALARQAGELGALGISALAPSYFKPASIAALVDSMAEIANAAPELPFYYYEIPSLTGIGLSPSAFLEEGARRIPNLAGVKFTSTNLVEYQLCAAVQERSFDVPFGVDEMLLAGLSFGAVGAVGSTYNFAAPLPPAHACVCGGRLCNRTDGTVSVRPTRLDAFASRLHGRGESSHEHARRGCWPGAPAQYSADDRSARLTQEGFGGTGLLHLGRPGALEQNEPGPQFESSNLITCGHRNDPAESRAFASRLGDGDARYVGIEQVG